MHIDNYLKCKWIKCPNQKTGWLNRYKNKAHTYVVYKKPTSDLGTNIEWKWRDEKGIPHKWKLKESWSNSTHIRQKKTLK